MKGKYLVISILSLSLGVFSCNSETKKEVKIEKKVVVEDEISDAEFEKEMQELDEDVENMEEGETKKVTIETKIEDGKKIVKEEKIIIKK